MTTQDTLRKACDGACRGINREAGKREPPKPDCDLPRSQLPTQPGFYWIRCGGPWTLVKIVGTGSSLFVLTFGTDTRTPLSTLDDFEFAPAGVGPAGDLLAEMGKAQEYASELELRLARAKRKLETIKLNDRSRPYQPGEVRESDDASPERDGAWATPKALAELALRELGGFDDDGRGYSTNKKLRRRIESLVRIVDELEQALIEADKALSDTGAPDRDEATLQFLSRCTRIKRLGWKAQSGASIINKLRSFIDTI